MQPLSIKLPTSTTKTAMPVIADKTWCKVKLVSIQQNYDINDGETARPEALPFMNWRFDVSQNQLPGTQIVSTDGKPIEPGKPGSIIFNKIFLRDKNNIDKVPDRAAQDTGRIQDALDNTGDPENDKGLPVRAEFDGGWVASAIGRECMALIVVDGEYGNKIKEFRSTEDPKFKLA